MDLTPTEEQQSLVEVLHDFAATEIRAAARACEDAGDVAPTIRSALHRMGIAGVAEEFGGQGPLDALTAVMIAEELGWGDPGIAYAVLGPAVVAGVLQRAAPRAVQAAILPALAAGGAAGLGGLAVAERDAACDVSRMETTAGGGRLHGTKYAVPDPGPSGVLLAVAEGPSIWLVPTAAGAAQGALRGPLEGPLRGAVEDKLGLRSARTLRIDFDGVAAERIDAGAAEATAALLVAKLATAGIALGLARAAVEYAAGYARERTAFGRPIGAFQAISFIIADRATDLDAARLLCWQAAWALEAGAGDAGRLAAAACGQAVAAAVAASDDAVQVLGGHGYMRDHPVELWYRDAMTLATLEAPWVVGDLALAGRFQARFQAPSQPPSQPASQPPFQSGDGAGPAR